MVNIDIELFNTKSMTKILETDKKKNSKKQICN